MSGTSRPAEQVDLLVVGGGMAGLTAAARATRAGVRVLVVDIAPQVGGTARYAGVAWSAPTREVIDRAIPNSVPELRHVVVDDLAEGLAWIRSVGVELGDPMDVLDFGRGHRFDTNHYLDACVRIVEDGGGQVWTGTEVVALVQDGPASGPVEGPAPVRGALLRRQDGSDLQVEAPWVLLSTGGFQGDPDLRAAYVHPHARDIQVRSNPFSAGAGYRLGRAAGAGVVGDDAGFYGHLVPAGVPFAGPEDFLPLSLMYSEHGLLFNLRGERFTDESAGDHLSTMALLEQPEARGLLIADARVHRDWVTKAYVAGSVSLDRFALASRRGARAGVADEVDELAFLPEEWGYPGEAIAAAVQDHNRRLRAGERVVPDRARDRTPLVEGPYYVLECAPAITFPFHGLRIDTSARVLDPAGRAVPGLLCAGADSGGVYHRAYAGGLANALTFAGRAVRTVLA